MDNNVRLLQSHMFDINFVYLYYSISAPYRIREYSLYVIVSMFKQAKQFENLKYE